MMRFDLPFWLLVIRNIRGRGSGIFICGEGVLYTSDADWIHWPNCSTNIDLTKGTIWRFSSELQLIMLEKHLIICLLICLKSSCQYPKHIEGYSGEHKEISMNSIKRLVLRYIIKGYVILKILTIYFYKEHWF